MSGPPPIPMKSLIVDETSDSIYSMDATSEFKFSDVESNLGELSEQPPKEPSPRLSKTSHMYDRGNKGYLDTTEAALRRMDSENKGFLDPDKVYNIMSSLQKEQQTSAALISSLQKEQVKANSLKRGILYMCVLAVFLAVSNIGTSFAAARLVKDTRVQYTSSDLVSKESGERVATTSKTVEVTIHPVDQDNYEGRMLLQRFLQEGEELACSQYYNTSDLTDTDTDWNVTTTNSTTATADAVKCAQVGQIDYDDAVALYQTFCPNWPFQNGETSCTGVEINEVMLNCNDKITRVFGGEYFPTGGYPGPYGDWTVFPAPSSSGLSLSADVYFTARQLIENPYISWAEPCLLPFKMKLYCKESTGNNCLVIKSLFRNNGVTQTCPGDITGLCPTTV